MKDKPYLDQAIEIIASGGWIMIPLFILGFLAFYVAARLFLYFLKGHFGKTSLEVCEEWVKDSSKAKGQVGEIIRYSQDGVEDLSDIQNRFAEIRTAEMPRLNQNITMLTILVNTAPLMGLLGTVLGMLQTFYGISLGGSEKNDQHRCEWYPRSPYHHSNGPLPSDPWLLRYLLPSPESHRLRKFPRSPRKHHPPTIP